MNLFLLITLQQYNEFFSKPENPIEIFQNILDSFKSSWNKFSYDSDHGNRIKDNLLAEVFSQMNIDFLDCHQTTKDNMNKYILDLNVMR